MKLRKCANLKCKNLVKFCQRTFCSVECFRNHPATGSFEKSFRLLVRSDTLA
jgi:hypothetical protein